MVNATVRAINESNQSVLATQVRVARFPWDRLKGLIGRPSLSPEEGLLIFPTQVVHGFFMKFDIDVLHMDREGRVLRLLSPLRRNRSGPVVWRGYYALEVMRSTIRRTGTLVGHRIVFETEDGRRFPSLCSRLRRPRRPP